MVPMYSDGAQIFVPRRVAAHLLGDVSLPSIDRLIRAGRLEVARVGRRFLIKRTSIEKLAERSAEVS